MMPIPTISSSTATAISIHPRKKNGCCAQTFTNKQIGLIGKMDWQPVTKG